MTLLGLPLGAFAAVLVIVALGLGLRTIWGFGDGMVAVPLLALMIGLEQGAAIMVLLSAVMALGLLRERPELVERGTVLRVLLGAIAGVPLGVLVLVDVDRTWAHRGLGLVLIAFGLGSLLALRKARLPHPVERRGWAADLGFGLLAGASSAAFDIAGPPLLIHGAWRGWDPDRLRLNLQAVFLPLALVTAAGHGWAGLWTREVLIYTAASLPLAALALVLGQRLRLRLGGEQGRPWIYGLIAVLGLVELIRTFV